MTSVQNVFAAPSHVRPSVCDLVLSLFSIYVHVCCPSSECNISRLIKSPQKLLPRAMKHVTQVLVLHSLVSDELVSKLNLLYNKAQHYLRYFHLNALYLWTTIKILIIIHLTLLPKAKPGLPHRGYPVSYLIPSNTTSCGGHLSLASVFTSAYSRRRDDGIHLFFSARTKLCAPNPNMAEKPKRTN